MKKSLLNRTFKVSKTLKVFLLLTAMSQVGLGKIGEDWGLNTNSGWDS